MTHRFLRPGIAVAGAALLLLACASTTPAVDDATLQQMMQASFRDQGIATVDRLRQDETDAACSRAEDRPLPDAQRRAIEAANLKTVKLPGDGRYLGDWKEGEKLAQNGRGMTWADPSAAPASNGGNCYNCHQLSKAEISYGTIGPSLFQYGRLRGVKDPGAPASRPIVEYTWSKLWNAKAFNACSGMPRFGAHGLLDENQLRDLMALLLDPKSPVNAE